MTRAGEYEHIIIGDLGRSPSGKTAIYAVRARRDGLLLGRIQWFGHWRQYCFYPSPDTVFSTGCLDDISATLRYANGRKGVAR